MDPGASRSAFRIVFDAVDGGADSRSVRTPAAGSASDRRFRNALGRCKSAAQEILHYYSWYGSQLRQL